MERETDRISKKTFIPKDFDSNMAGNENDSLELEEIAFSQNTEAMRELAANEDALVPYNTKSNGSYKMETLIPKNMLFEVQKALNDLTKEK